MNASPEANTNPFAQRMARLADVELMELLASREGYQEAAIAAAEAELDSRQLSEAQRSGLEAELLDRKMAAAVRNAPLEFGYVILFFLVPVGVSWLAAWNYDRQGLERKYRMSWRVTKFGCMFYLLLFAIYKASRDGTLVF